MRIVFVRLAGIGLCLSLAACQLGSGLSGLPSLSMLAGRAETVVLDGAIRVVAPRGYCIEPQSAAGSAQTAVVFLGRCAARSKVVAALVTISIGAEASGGVMTAGGVALAAFFQSEEGRATLSRSAKAEDVTLISASGSESVLWLYLNDAAIGSYWRAISAISGRLVTLSATGTVEHPLLPEDGRALLEASYSALQKANR